MTKRWMKERKNDRYYVKAKREHYRSRAAYKLLQLQEKFGILFAGMRCVDLGAAPGGWLQVEQEIAGPGGRVLGIDLATIRPVEGVTLLKGDVTSPATAAKLLDAAGGKVDVLLSDMSPDISGNYSLDHARSVDLVRTALALARLLLKEGGSMAVKLFDGELTHELLEDMKRSFGSVRVSKPEASRKQSSEIYIVAGDFFSR